MFALGAFVALLAAFVIFALVGAFVWLVVSTMFTGIVLGVLARLIIPGRQPIGILATIVSGWLGSLIGGAIGYAAFGRHHDRFLTLLIEIGVAVVAVLGWSALAKQSGPPGPTQPPQQHRVIDI